MAVIEGMVRRIGQNLIMRHSQIPARISLGRRR
jgi:hypothetical protein